MNGEIFVPASKLRDLTAATNAARQAAADLMVAMTDELPDLKAQEVEAILKEGGHVGIEITMTADGTRPSAWWLSVQTKRAWLSQRSWRWVGRPRAR